MRDKVYLLHIVEAIDSIEEFTKSMTFEIFSNDLKTQSAVIRQLEIIGEACNKLSAEFRKENKNILWHEIISMRNLLIHEYFGVDITAVWSTIKNDLKSLREFIDNRIN